MSFRWWRYAMPGGSVAYLTVRPDSHEDEALGWSHRIQPSVRFSFTDDLVEWPGFEHHWYPWIPCRPLPVEMVWAFMSMAYAMEQKRPQRFWLHCDSSSMRAPTFFGLYLLSRWGPDHAKETVEYVMHSCDQARQGFSCPMRYAEVSIERDPGVAELVWAWQHGGRDRAYEAVMALKKLK